MRRRRYSAEAIVNKLREADVLLAKGNTVARTCKQLGITDFASGSHLGRLQCRWRLEYGGSACD